MKVIRGGAALCEAAQRWDCVPRVVAGKATVTVDQRATERASALAAYRKARREMELI